MEWRGKEWLFQQRDKGDYRPRFLKVHSHRVQNFVKGKERIGADWSGKEGIGLEWTGKEWTGLEWSGVERRGKEWLFQQRDIGDYRPRFGRFIVTEFKTL